MNKASILIAIPVAALAFFLGMKSGQSGSKSDDGVQVASRPGTPVATFDGASVSAEELKAQIEEQTPFVRIRYATPDGKKEFLDGLVRFELLAREAARKGYQKDAEIQRAMKKNMVATFVQKEFEEAQQRAPLADDELRKFYDDHKEDYVKPERVRIAHLFIEARDADAKAKRRPAAEAALAEVKAKDGQDFQAFANAVKLRSEDQQSRAIGGDLHYLSREELEKRIGKEATEIAWGLREAGKIYDGLVETPEGFQILKMVGRESALDLKFEDVKEALRNRVVYSRRTENYNKFIADLEKKANLRVDQAALEKVQINLGAPTPSMPSELPLPPGTIPPAPLKKVDRPGDVPLPPGAPAHP